MDILIVGKIGMGKSTTAYKLVIANQSGHECPRGQYSNEEIKETTISGFGIKEEVYLKELAVMSVEVQIIPMRKWIECIHLLVN